jgi:hypothetical protein
MAVIQACVLRAVVFAGSRLHLKFTAIVEQRATAVSRGIMRGRAPTAR